MEHAFVQSKLSKKLFEQKINKKNKLIRIHV
jgi:hypothetical protein